MSIKRIFIVCKNVTNQTDINSFKKSRRNIKFTYLSNSRVSYGSKFFVQFGVY